MITSAGKTTTGSVNEHWQWAGGTMLNQGENKEGFFICVIIFELQL